MRRLEEHFLEHSKPPMVINNVQSHTPDSEYSFDVLDVS